MQNLRARAKFAIITGAVWASLVPSALAQTAIYPARIAYEYCYPDYFGWDMVCDIHTWIDGTDAFFVRGGIQPKWSPDATKIAFVAVNYDVWGDILVARVPDGQVIANVTNHPAADWAPAWSRDGTKIAFASNRSGSAELYLANLDGTGLVQLTNAIGFTGAFAWSPDGRTIAVSREVAGARDLYKMNADGSNLVRLTSNGALSGTFTWTTDGGRLTFDCSGYVCAVNADGTGLVQLVAGSSGVFSPTPDRLAFVQPRADGSSAIALRESDGQIVDVAAGTPGHTPLWSDGASLLFQGTQIVAYLGRCYFGEGAHNADDFCVGVTGIYAVDADGSDLRLLMVGTNPDLLAWRPGEPRASFTHQCSGASCVFDATGSFDPDGVIKTYAWQFGDGTTGAGTSPSHTYATGNSYVVTLTATDDDGVTSTTSRTVTANAPPVASIAVVCNGPTCTFDASGSSDPDGSITWYFWNFGDGYWVSGSDKVTVSHKYTTGTFTAHVSVTDSGGASATTSATVEVVNALPIPSFTAACNGFLCTFDASGSKDPDGTITSFFWHFGDGSGAYGATTTHQYTYMGNFEVTLTVTDDTGQQATYKAPPPLNPPPMHVGDLDGSIDQLWRSSWWATATVTIHDADDRPLANAYVTALWGGGVYSVSTDSTGKCVFTASADKNTRSMTLTVTNVTHSSFVYHPAANHDPDRDSDGTTITFGKN